MPLPLAAIAGVGLQALGTVAKPLGGMIAEKLDPTSAAYLQQLQQGARKLKEGKLGWTAAQKAQSVSEARQQIDAAAKGQEAELRREAAASGGFGRSGAQQAAAADIAQARAEGVAQARKGAEALSQQQAQIAAEQIRRDMKERLGQVTARGEQFGEAAGGLLSSAGRALAPGVDLSGASAMTAAAE